MPARGRKRLRFSLPLLLPAASLVAQGPPLDRAALSAAIERGLSFLAKEQQPDGSFAADWVLGDGTAADIAGLPGHHVGVTGLAVLAFVGDGHTIKVGAHRDRVRQAVNWLVDLQLATGGFRPSRFSADFVLDQAMAATAVIEVWGWSDQHRPLSTPTRNAAKFLFEMAAAGGGWGEARGGAADALCTAWALRAVASAKEFRLDSGTSGCDEGLHWLASVTSPTTGRPGFRKRGEPLVLPLPAGGDAFRAELSELLTAAALSVRQLLQDRTLEDALVKQAVATILRSPPRWDKKAGSVDFMYWFFAANALRERVGEDEQNWIAQMVKIALEHQRTDGKAAGSWDPVDAWGRWGGRMQATATIVLALEAARRRK